MKRKKAKSEKIILGKCQYRIWKVQMELETYACLFIAGGATDVEIQKLTGAGLAFERLAKKLNKVSDRLDEEVVKDLS